MKTIKPTGLIACASLLISTAQSFGVVDQALQVQGTNLVLSWPSLGYEHYLIQYRPTLDTNTPWTQLTNNYPANSTNRATFTIFGAIPPAGASGGGGGSGSGGPLAPDSAGELAALDVGTPVTELDEATVIFLAEHEVFPAYVWDLERRPPHVWELECRPPLPWDPDAVINASPSLEAQSMSTAGLESNGPLDSGSGEGEGGDPPSMGFYRVFHIPDWSFNVTNYTYDGPTFFPVDFKDYMDRMANIQVLLNGEPSPYAEFTSYVSGGQTNWGVGVYFDRLTNGTYQIQLVTTLRLNDEIGDNSIFLVLSNLTRPIVVFNQVTFPDWNDFIQGDTYTFNAQIANPDTDWWIDIYDLWGNYVNTGSGHTTNGQVSWTWDLYDWLGNNRDDFDSDPYFFSEITFSMLGDGPQTTAPTPPPVKGYPNRGEWVIAFQDRWYIDAPGYPGDLQGKYEEAIEAIWGGPFLVGDTAWWFPLKFGTNVYTQAEREHTWTNLLAGIGDLYNRNFYYHGHGGAPSLGADRHTLGTNGLVTGSALTSRYSKSQIFSWQVALKTRYNRYRFVFLDGCSTAEGDLPNAFNISKTNHTIEFYENHRKHPRPSVFVGWNQVVGGEGWGTAYNRLKFQSYWMGNWANDADGPSIELALTRANNGASWVSHQKLWSALRVYGYKDMRIRDYNRKGDWRWP